MPRRLGLGVQPRRTESHLAAWPCQVVGSEREASAARLGSSTISQAAVFVGAASSSTSDSLPEP